MIEGIQYFGFFGLLLLLIAWLPETFEMIKNKKAHLNKKFILLYFCGSALLAIYAYFINDLVFMVLNVLLTLIALLNAFYELKK